MTSMHSIPHISEADLNGFNIKAHDIIAMIEHAIRGAEAGTVWAAPKAVIDPPIAATLWRRSASWMSRRLWRQNPWC